MTRWLYLSVSLQMLPDCHSLLDKVVEILGQVRGQTLGLEDPQNLVAGDKTHLGHTVGVPQNHTCDKQAGNLGHCVFVPVRSKFDHLSSCKLTQLIMFQINRFVNVTELEPC